MLSNQWVLVGRVFTNRKYLEDVYKGSTTFTNKVDRAMEFASRREATLHMWFHNLSEMAISPHTVECVKAVEAYNAWAQKWKKHCRYCGASGRWDISETREDPADGGPCEDCIGADNPKCPRCAAPWADVEQPLCTTCGYDLAHPDVAPYTECCCYEDDDTEDRRVTEEE
jgi:hypothetical protein